MKKYALFALLAVASFGLMTGCGSQSAQADGQAPPPPQSVSTVDVALQTVPIYKDYVAQTFARDQVEVRGRVDGYIESRLFQVGSDVPAGQPLYVLDLRPYQAAVQKAHADLANSEATLEFARKQVSLLEAQAALAQAEANLLKAQQDVDRLRPLISRDAAPKQDLDNALAALKANQANISARQANVEQARLSTKAQIDTGTAQVESKRAQVKTAELDLEYATIRSPIDGRVGESLVQVGGLVSRNSPLPLTTVVPLNPIWVRFKVSESEQAEFRKLGRAALHLVLADGSDYPLAGQIQNTVNQVDSKTGTLEMQATFPNPQGTVLPGQFGRVRVQVEDRKDTILIPQRAVQELQGLQSVLTVGPDNKVLARSITTGDRVGEQWVVRQGLQSGDRVIVEGLQRTAPGAAVNPQPFHADNKGGK
ncbi:MAG: efflux RND transporter periplasmic adaptor subunit [Acidobacteriota bacterium]